MEDENEAISDELSKLGELNENLRRRIEELEAKSKADDMTIKKVRSSLKIFSSQLSLLAILAQLELFWLQLELKIEIWI